jgi:hypothetical protein
MNHINFVSVLRITNPSAQGCVLVSTLAVIPLLLAFKKPSGGGAPAHTVAAE